MPTPLPTSVVHTAVPRCRAEILAVLLLALGTLALPASGILLIGDSITYPVVGGGGSGYPEMIPGAEWYGCIGGIARMLDSSQCGVFMPEIGGSYLLDVVLPMAGRHDVATIMYGTNDFYWLDVGIPEDDFVADVLYIATSLRDAGVGRVIFLGPPDRAVDLPGPQMGYYAAMLPTCEAIDWLECGPNFQEVIDASHYSVDDGIHPNTQGAHAMADALMEYLPEPSRPLLSLAATLALAVRRRLSVL